MFTQNNPISCIPCMHPSHHQGVFHTAPELSEALHRTAKKVFQIRFAQKPAVLQKLTPPSLTSTSATVKSQRIDSIFPLPLK